MSKWSESKSAASCWLSWSELSLGGDLIVSITERFVDVFSEEGVAVDAVVAVESSNACCS